MFNFFNFFFILQVFTSTFIFFSINPIHSILLLILLFFESAVTLAAFNLEFVSLLFILIYVGAIAIPFLFVIMMLQLKLNNLEIILSLPFIFSLNFTFILFFLIPIFLIDFFSFTFLNFFNLSFFFKLLEESFIEIIIIGQFLYNYSFINFLLAGILLLLALLGSIVLSLEYNKLNFITLIKKLVRNSNFVILFK